MANISAAVAFKLGLNLEYLRGINTVNMNTLCDLSPVPFLLENQPALRYSAARVADVLTSLAKILNDADLPKTRESAVPFNAMRAEIEDFLSQAPEPDAVTLRDPFADQLVSLAETVTKTAREELK